MSASEPPIRLRLSRRRWRQMLAELETRGRHCRESGAFLLGSRPRRGIPKVRHAVYFDDLEPGALNGAVHLTHAGYSALWEHCARLDAEVLGDVHTHPGKVVSQSGIDQENPLIAQRGHIALIVPNYATGRIRLTDIGQYSYLGDDGWNQNPRLVRHWRWGR